MSNEAFNERELADLLSAFIDGELTSFQRARLAEIVRVNPVARSRYLDHCRLHAFLAWEHGVLGDVPFPVEEADPAASGNVVAIPFRRRWARPLALAAAVALVLGVCWQAVIPVLRQRAWASEVVVGFVERSAGGLLSVKDIGRRLFQGDTLHVGDYELMGGLVNLRLTNGIEVVVEAPARFRLRSPQLLVLDSGRVSANVPEEGKGFTVWTPSAEVIDHGTEFGVEVTAGLGSEIHVFKGEVEVKSRTLENDSLRLFTDQATRVDEVAGSPAGITVAPDRFLRSFDEPSARYAKKIRQLDPVLYYRMQPSSDGHTLIDQSGNGLDARIESGTTERPLFGRGRLGSAFRMQGPRARTHAVLSDYPKATNNQLSAVAWVHAESRPRWASILKNWGEGKIGQFHFGLVDHSGELEIVVRGSKRGGARVRDSEPFPLGSWQHVAFVADGETLHLYRNGREIGNVPQKPLATPTIRELGIGTKLIGNHPERPGAPTDFWHGRLDEVAVFNHALDSGTIRELYETESPLELVKLGE